MSGRFSTSLRELRRRFVQPIHQDAIRRIGHALSHGGEDVRHRVLDAPLALEQHERGERGGVRIAWRVC